MAQAVGTQLLVSNVRAQQRLHTTLVDITYDLETVGDLPVWASLFLSTDSGATFPNLCRTVTGDVGAGVLPGADRHIVWNVGTDFPGDLINEGCRLRVTAYDRESVEDYAYVASGTFMMGSPEDEPERTPMETQHQVTLTHGIYVQTTEVTNQQYMEMAQWAYDHGYVTATSASIRDNLDGSTRELLLWNSGNCNISFNGGTFTVDAGKEHYPVMDVTWYGAVAYCDWLSLQQGRTRAYSHVTWRCNGGNPYAAVGYRLPTEAEWEYACRAGTQTPFATGACLDAGTEANYQGAYPYTGCQSGPFVGWTTPVGSYPANAFGLHDMHGNLYEWCNDLVDSYGGTVTDPVGASTGSSRVLRGGYWNIYAQYCRSAARYDNPPEHSSQYRGFRAVRSADPGAPQLGTITIDPEPNNINAPWYIVGPDGYSKSGTGDSWLTNMSPGDYTLTWGTVVGWTPPSPAAVTQTLTLGGMTTITGLYVVSAGAPDGFVSIPAGTFTMGSPATEPLRSDDETQHQVTLTHGIYVPTSTSW
jgi:formylglycine-generating enzyme required for sulfatase activity